MTERNKTSFTAHFIPLYIYFNMERKAIFKSSIITHNELSEMEESGTTRTHPRVGHPTKPRNSTKRALVRMVTHNK